MPNRTQRLAPIAALVFALLAAVPGAASASESAFASAPDGRLVVRWRSDAPAALTIDGVAAVHTSTGNAHRSVVVARGGRAGDVAASLLRDPRVRSVVPDAVLSVADFPADAPPDDEHYAAYQGDMPHIGMPGAWTLTMGSPSVVVAVLDTGYDETHPDLAAIPVVDPYNARTGSKTVNDVYGHGTHVAGTIAAQTNNVIGVAGMAPGVTIMPVKVMDNNGQGYWSDFLEGVDWARTHGASIVNLSLGGTLSASQAAAFQPTFDAAYDAGMMVVAAAGNNNRDEPFYPASFDHVVTVSATNNNDAKASFSNYGPKVDLAAPGVSILSTYPGGLYKWMSGTSMATPHVVGLAALIRSYHPAYTVDEVETAMEVNAIDLGTPGRDDTFGYGRIQADQAVAWLAPDVIPPTATLTTPAAGATHASEFAHPTVAFSESVSGAGAGTISLMTGAGTPVDSTVSYDPATRRATITPAAPMTSRKTYVVTVANGIADLSGNPLTATSFTFTTGDHIAPRVAWVSPKPGTSLVWRGVSPRVAFSEGVLHVSKSTITLRNLRTGKLVTVSVAYDWAKHVATLDPAIKLMSGTWFQIKVRSDIEDAGGNNIAAGWFKFKTRA